LISAVVPLILKIAEDQPPTTTTETVDAWMDDNDGQRRRRRRRTSRASTKKKKKNDLVIDPTPFLSEEMNIDGVENQLLVVGDDSFLTFDGQLWAIPSRNTNKNNNNDTNSKNALKHVGTLVGLKFTVTCLLEKDDTTLVTAASDNTLKEWNKTTLECLRTLTLNPSFSCVSMKMTKDKLRVVCGMNNGMIEVRSASDLGQLITTFRMHGDEHEVNSLCGLYDRTFLSAASRKLKHWDEDGKVLRIFSGPSYRVLRVIELRRDIAVSLSEEDKFKIWRVSSGECLHTVHCRTICACTLERIAEDKFVTGAGFGLSVYVWDDNGECVQKLDCGPSLYSMSIVGDAFVTIKRSFNQTLVEARRLM